MGAYRQAAIDYGNADPVPTIGDFADRGQLLEIGCEICSRHGYFRHGDVNLPRHLTLEEASWLLVCGNCGARNRVERDREARCPFSARDRPARPRLE
jgi:hypothetical protein